MHMVLYQLLQMCPAEFVSERNTSGWAPLHILANNVDRHDQRYSMIVLLCNARADVEAPRGRHNMTPLMMASASGHVQGVRALLHCGADPEATNNEGSTARDLADRNNSQINRLLQDVGGRYGAGYTGTGRLIPPAQGPK